MRGRFWKGGAGVRPARERVNRRPSATAPRSRSALRRQAGLWAVVAILLLAVAAVAQPPGGPRGRGRFGRSLVGDGFAALISVPDVQRELAVNSQQRELLEALQDDLRRQRRGLFGGSFGGPPGGAEDPATAEAVRKRLQELERQGDELVAVILELPQTERLSQLRLQREGLRALDRPEFIKSLGLSDAQVEKLRQIRAAPQSPGGTAREEGRGEQQRADQEKLNADVSAVLTKEQKDLWEKMKGKPFQFPDRWSPFGARGRRNNGL